MDRLLPAKSRDDVENIGSQEASECVQEILEALFVTDPQKDLFRARNRSRSGRIEGTCQWILERPEYISWRETASPQLLMIVGEPGIGKTAMATFLVERLVSEAARDCQTFAYFFCNHAEPQRRTATSILKGLLHQIMTRRPQLIEHAERIVETHGVAGFDDFETLWFLFVRVVQDPRVGQLTLLIDSLDNCDVALRKVLVKRLEELLRPATAVTNHHWRLCILTRPHAWDLGTCRRLVSGWTDLEWMTVITMSFVVVHADLKKLIEDEVNQVADAKQWRDDTRQAVKAQLEASNGGTFLWISLALKCVADTKEDFVLRRLKRYSGSLRELYVRVLRKIDAEDVEIAECTLHYVLGASRPLTLTELAIALYYRDSQNRTGQLLPTDSQIDELKSALRCCDLLLRVNGKGKHATVEFIHQSVADFLVEHNMPLGLRRYKTSATKAVERLSMACAAYLCTPELKSLSHDVQRMVRAAKSKTSHTISSHSSSRDSIIERQASISDSSAFSPASSDIWTAKSDVPLTTKQMALLQYATSTWAAQSSWKQLLALPIHVMELIKLHSRPQDLIFETAKIAISEGYDLIFRHLIKILLRTLSLDDGLHLFQAAIQYDESGIEPAVGTKERVFWTEELPDAEAIYHELKRRWNNLVHAAASIGLIDVLKFCIQHEDDIVLKDVNGLTALHMATKERHPKIVKMLTHTDREKGMIKEKDRHGQIPLHIAVTNVCSANDDQQIKEGMSIIKTLLKSDFCKTTLHAQSHRGETPLHLAIKHPSTSLLLQRQTSLVKLLLEADLEKASVYMTDPLGRLPLHDAAIAGNVEVVELLSDADLGSHTLVTRDRYGKTALDYCVEFVERERARNGQSTARKDPTGHELVVEFLRTQSMLLMFGEVIISREIDKTIDGGKEEGNGVGMEVAMQGGRPKTIAVRSLSV